MRKIIASIIAFLVVAVMGTVWFNTPANAAPGDSSGDPIVVTNVSEVPQGAVEDAVSTYSTTSECDTTRSWVLTVPAQEEVSHQEYRYKREIDAVEEVSHLLYSIEKSTRTSTEVEDFKTQYHFRKFTHEKTRTWQDEVSGPDLWWNFSPNNTQANFFISPHWPTDSRGTWQGPHENGGPSQDTYGKFAQGNPLKGGNWFYRQQGEVITPAGWGPWSEWSAWTPWVPETHTSWEDRDAPLGVPQFHSQGGNSKTQWYREWQAQFDGQTRQVKTGSHTEYGEWGPWVKDSWDLTVEPEIPADTDTARYRAGEPIKVIDMEAIPAFTQYYVNGEDPSLNKSDATWETEQPDESWEQFDERKVVDSEAKPAVVTYYAWSDGKVCEVTTPTPTPTPTEPPVTETPTPTPEPPVTTPTPTPEPPVVTETPVPQPPKDTPQPPKNPEPPVTTALPNAGADDHSGALGLGIILILVGSGLILVSRRRS